MAKRVKTTYSCEICNKSYNDSNSAFNCCPPGSNSDIEIKNLFLTKIVAVSGNFMRMDSELEIYIKSKDKTMRLEVENTDYDSYHISRDDIDKLTKLGISTEDRSSLLMDFDDWTLDSEIILRDLNAGTVKFAFEPGYDTLFETTIKP